MKTSLTTLLCALLLSGFGVGCGLGEEESTAEEGTAEVSDSLIESAIGSTADESAADEGDDAEPPPGERQWEEQEDFSRPDQIEDPDPYPWYQRPSPAPMDAKTDC